MHEDRTLCYCLHVNDTIRPVLAKQKPQRQVAVLWEDAFPAPRSNLRRSLPHCHRRLHSLPGLLPKPSAGFLPMLCGAGGGHAYPGTILGHEQQKCRKLQPPWFWPGLSSLPLRLQLLKPCSLLSSADSITRVPVSVPAQVGERENFSYCKY